MHAILQETRSELLALARKVNTDPTTTWTAALNPRFMNSTLENIKKSLGSLHMDLSDYPTAEFNVDVKDLPTEFESRKAWPQCASIGVVPYVEDCYVLIFLFKRNMFFDNSKKSMSNLGLRLLISSYIRSYFYQINL